jgi:uncharacterized membrane protein
MEGVADDRGVPARGMNKPSPPLPDHVETSVHDSASLHAEHEASAGRLERWAGRVTSAIGQPRAIVVVPGLVGLWILASLGLQHLNVATLDPAPFAWLQLTLSIAAVFMTVVILASQRRSQILASRREQLMLQLAFASDHKVAKVIALLEELRRDDPTIENRSDHEAAAMARTSDPQTVVDAIEVAHEHIVVAAKDAAARG